MRHFVLAACTMLAACAPAPDDIKAWHYDPAAYRSQTCPSLTIDYAKVSDELATLSNAQSEKRTGDTAGILLVGMPLSSIAAKENIEGSIAQAKGKKAALSAVLAEKNCPGNWQ